MTSVNPMLTTLKTMGLPAQPQAAAKPSAGDDGDWDFSFQNLLDVVNPLQHLPVIGTLYRAITGDNIGAPAKVAGDALYGGLWGAISGLADVAFEAVTGKDFGGTMLALFTGSDKQEARTIAAATPAPAPQAAAMPARPETRPDISALTASLAQKGIDSEIAQRALFAYGRAATLPNTVLAAAQ